MKCRRCLAAVDFFEGRRQKEEGRNAEDRGGRVCGGRVDSVLCAALDQRIEAALVSGYFDSRQRLWEEPIYRNVFGLLREFGDAEIASLIAPRGLDRGIQRGAED